MNGYDLTRAWYNYKFQNPKKVKAAHSDMFFYIVDLWNRLGQKKEFGLPTTVTMEALGVGSYNTYKKTLDDLFEIGFIKLVSDSKNQHQSKIIALSKIDKATDEALDKATIKATDEALDKATDTIVKQLNNTTTKQLNNNTLLEKETKEHFSFRKVLIQNGGLETLVDDWLKVRKTKKATNSGTALSGFLKQVEISKLSIDEVLIICIEKDWKGFNASWIKNLQNQNSQNGKQQFTNPVKTAYEFSVDRVIETHASNSE